MSTDFFHVYIINALCSMPEENIIRSLVVLTRTLDIHDSNTNAD
ncbi:hypothetical protein ABIB00_007422 [Bradyrhizobium sp. LB14.3]